MKLEVIITQDNVSKARRIIKDIHENGYTERQVTKKEWFGLFGKEIHSHREIDVKDGYWQFGGADTGVFGRDQHFEETEYTHFIRHLSEISVEECGSNKITFEGDEVTYWGMFIREDM